MALKSVDEMTVDELRDRIVELEAQVKPSSERIDLMIRCTCKKDCPRVVNFDASAGMLVVEDELELPEPNMSNHRPMGMYLDANGIVELIRALRRGLLRMAWKNDE